MPFRTGPPDMRTPLDKHGPPGDNRDLNATAQHHGLMAKLSGNAGDAFMGDGEWVPLAQAFASLSLVSLADDTFQLYDDGDPTRIAYFQLAGIPVGSSYYALPPLAAAGNATLAALEQGSQVWTGGLNQFNGETYFAPAGVADGWLFAAVIAQDTTNALSLALDGDPSSNPILLFPATGGTMLTSLNTVSPVANKTFNSTNVLQCNSASSGVSFSDSGTASKRLRVITSSAVGNNAIAIKSTAARTYTTPDVTSTFLTWAAGTAGFLPAAGDLIYGAGTATGMAALTIGGANTMLTSTGSAPQWVTIASIIDAARSWATLQKFPDDKIIIGGSADITKALRWELDGATTGKTLTITSNHTDTRALSYPDIDSALVGSFYRQSGLATVSNSTSETTLTGTAAGTLTLPANFFATGKGVRVTASGSYGVVGVATIRMKLKKGTTVIWDSGAFAIGTGGTTWRVMGTLIAQPSFALTGGGVFEAFNATYLAPATIAMPVVAGTSGTSEALDLTAQWNTASASNTITCDMLHLEALG